MSPALDGLPNEIISAVFAHLTDEQETLLALCRVSRYFCSLVTPSIYRVIRHLPEERAHDHQRNPLLLRSLLRNPALGSHIVEVQITAPSLPYEDVTCFSDEEWVLLRAQVAKLYETGLFTEELYLKSVLVRSDVRDGIGSEECWNKNVRDGQWDAVFCLMLFCCPRLEKIRGFEWDKWNGVGPLYPRCNVFAFFMNAVALGNDPERLPAQKPSPAPILPHYRVAHISHDTQRSGRSIVLQSVMPFFFSPAIELIRVDPNIEGRGTQRHRFWGERQFFFKKLVLKQSTIGASSLGYILNSCDVLEEFVLEYGIDDGTLHYDLFGNDQRMVYDQGPLPGGLLKSKKSLRRLELAQGFNSLYAKNMSHFDQTLGSLVEFESLTHLAVKLEFLIWHGKPTHESGLCGLMPRSLEFLSIATEDVLSSADLSFCEATVSRKEASLLRNMRHLEELVLRKESFVPHLRHLVLDGMRRDTADGTALTALKLACMANNVRLSVVLYHPYFTGPDVQAMGSETVSF